MGSQRVLVSIASDCSNACVFCAHDPSSSVGEVDERIRAAHAGGARAITFGGGEPTLHVDRLTAAVELARSIGMTAIGVQTNGYALAACAASLGAAGLTDVHLSVHGPNARAHDYHTGRDGSFETLWAANEAALRAGLVVVATTLVTRSSYRVLSEMPLLLRARGVAAWHLAVPHARGRAQSDFDRVYPRLAMALPFALHAMQAAAKLGLPTYVSGAPLCLLGPGAQRAIRLPEPSRTFHERCAECAARSACVGIDAGYLARFDGDELRAREDLPASLDDAFAAYFVGVGPMISMAERPMHESATRARRALPMYGRPQRALREVSTRDAKTGEALREILPTLFEGRTTKDGHS